MLHKFANRLEPFDSDEGATVPQVYRHRVQVYDPQRPKLGMEEKWERSDCMHHGQEGKLFGVKWVLMKMAMKYF